MKQNSLKPKILFKGAEALILLNKNKIIKKRVKKSYRLKELDDKIRKLRTRSETKLLEKASKIIPVPKIKSMDEDKTKNYYRKNQSFLVFLESDLIHLVL